MPLVGGRHQVIDPAQCPTFCIWLAVSYNLFSIPHLVLETGEICVLKTSLKLLCGELIGGWERGRDAVLVSQAGDNSSRDYSTAHSFGDRVDREKWSHLRNT